MCFSDCLCRGARAADLWMRLMEMDCGSIPRAMPMSSVKRVFGQDVVVVLVNVNHRIFVFLVSCSRVGVYIQQNISAVQRSDEI